MIPKEGTSWHSYPSIFALGHKALEDLFDGPVVIEEKVDGSQFSFGRFNGELRVRSKGKEMMVDAPEKMFTEAIQVVQGLDLHDGWTYRGEYLQKPKHNALAYDRIPKNHIILFDINTSNEVYLNPVEKREEAERIGLEVVPLFAHIVTGGWNLEKLRALLEMTSILGGQKIEGFVIKNYGKFGPDKKCLMGKYVSEAFKEVHRKAWGESNPTQGDYIIRIAEELKTPARWNKAILHLKERGELEDSPRDIGKLINEIRDDVIKEERERIEKELFDHFWPSITRLMLRGFPEWYKEQLAAKQFEEVGS